MNIQRGNIYYIHKGESYGCEMIAGRPGIIVSNDKNNETSSVVEIVYLTTQPKADLPTHVQILTTGRVSTALCEQISTVDISRLGDYVGCCSDAEILELDKALAKSIDLITTPMARSAIDEARIRAEVERDTYKQLYEDLLKSLIK